MTKNTVAQTSGFLTSLPSKTSILPFIIYTNIRLEKLVNNICCLHEKKT